MQYRSSWMIEELDVFRDPGLPRVHARRPLLQFGGSGMKAYELQETSGVSGLRLVEKPMPSAGPGEVLVRIRAVTLNYRDILTIKGGYGSRQKHPLIPLSDGAGTVEAVGSGVRAFKPGDRVIGSFFESWHGGAPASHKFSRALGGSVDGVLAEYRTFPQETLVSTPNHLSDAEAASLPCAALTAWSAVVQLGQIKPGDVVLTQGTGGVSLFALQFAKLCGARVIATSSSDEKIEKLNKLGANETINYVSSPEWGKSARKLTGDRGVDLVVEVGGIGTLNESIRSTRIGGSIALIGVVAGPAHGEVRLPLIVMQQQRIQGVTVGSTEELQSMVRAIDAHKMHPVVDRIFSFEEVKEAFEHMSARKHFGKVAISIP
jgi:NADPH:quinone reductase-like Zn-dependent oxidoreductase